MGRPSPARPPYIRVSSLVPYSANVCQSHYKANQWATSNNLEGGQNLAPSTNEVIRIVSLRQSGRHQRLRKRMVVTGAPGKPL